MKTSESKKYSTAKDFLVTGESFDLLYNAEKEMLITSPQPSEEKLSKYYESEDYISHTDTKKGLLSFLYHIVKNWSLNKKVNLIKNEFGGTGSILDIGAGTGDFLKKAKTEGWNIYGVEPNDKAVQISETKGVHLKLSIDDFAGQQFDVVTLWHVLEHLPNLEETIKKIESLVRPNGILIIAVPNFKSYDAKYYKEFWAAYDVPRHLWHFSKKSMGKLFSEDFTLKKIKPMFFDSFYVCLLSEKHKSGNSFSIKSLFIGFLSNMKSIRTKEYSSLIYCFRKGE